MKNVVLGVTGGIAAYKSAEIVSRLKKLGVHVDVIMTAAAQQFVTPLTFQSLSGSKVVTDMFDTAFVPEIEHISLAKKADILLVAPATANFVGKLANGIADDMLSTVAMACRGQIVIAPAMNTAMYENTAFQENLERLRQRGVRVIEPISGLLACNDVGRGKMQEPKEIVEEVRFLLNRTDELKGKRILVSAGATMESIDPVRFITNRSTGKMGYAVAAEAARRGAEVILVSGRSHEEIPFGLSAFVRVESAEEMYRAIIGYAESSDIIIKAAAVADYTPSSFSNRKLKKSDDDLKIELKRTKDILLELGSRKRADQILVGFAAETNDVLENAASKIKRKNLDLIVANDVTAAGAGFGATTNIVTLISANGGSEALPMMDKAEVAERIFDKIAELMNS